MLKKILILFSCAALAGAVFGWSRTKKFAPSKAIARAVVTPASVPRRVRTAEDFLNMARERQLKAEQLGHSPLTEKLADWSDEEIIATLNASLTDPDVVLTAGAASGLDGSLLGEWMRRDLDSALAWYDKLESRLANGRLAQPLAYHWPAEKAAQGFAFLKANRELFPEPIGYQLLSKSISGAAQNGPAALATLLSAIRKDGFELKTTSPINFPPHFDFSSLARNDDFRALVETKNANPLVQSWYEQNRDQAFDWLVKNDQFKCLSALKIDYGWLGGKFETLTAEQRVESKPELEKCWIINPAAYAVFVNEIGDPAAAEQARDMGVQTIFEGNGDSFIQQLESMDEPTRRLDLLANAIPSDYFKARPDYRRFDAVSEAKLRQKLAEWSATDGQIEAIISRFKP